MPLTVVPPPSNVVELDDYRLPRCDPPTVHVFEPGEPRCECGAEYWADAIGLRLPRPVA